MCIIIVWFISIDVQCPELPPILNGSIKYVEDDNAPFDLGTMATYMCNDGFFLDRGDERNCTTGEAGTGVWVWTGQEPQCVCKLAISLLINIQYNYILIILSDSKK